MTSLLKEAFDVASSLPADRQDAIAKLILAEIEDERRWDEAFGLCLYQRQGFSIYVGQQGIWIIDRKAGR